MLKELGVQPQIGRFFSAEEQQWGRHQVVVLPYRMWMRAFGGDPAAVGRTVNVEGEPWTVIGMMPRGFRFDNPEIELWAPISFKPDSDMLTRGNHFVEVIARIKSGIAPAAAQKDLSQVAEALASEVPNNVGMGAALRPLRESLSGPVRPALLLLLGAVGLVLLIACANLANLKSQPTKAGIPHLFGNGTEDPCPGQARAGFPSAAPWHELR